MSEADPQFLPTSRHRLAYRAIKGEGPPLVWCGGFASDMDSTKALAKRRAIVVDTILRYVRA